MPNQAAVDAGKKFVESLSDEEKKAYESILKNDAALEALGNGVLMQSDYTRKTQLTKAEQEKAAAELEKLKAKKEELDKWSDSARTKYDQTLAENERLRAYREEASSRMQRLANKYSIPEEEIKLQMEATGDDADKAAKDVAGQGGRAAERGDGAPTFDREYVEGRLDGVIGFEARLQDLADEHYELFGTRLKRTELLRKANEVGATDLDKFWREEFEVDQKREEIEKEKREKEIEKIRQETREEVLSEINSPSPGSRPQRRPGQGSAVLDRFVPEDEKGEEGERGGDVLSRAISDYSARLAKASAVDDAA